MGRPTHPAGALRHRNFRLFLAGQSISLVGTWMQRLGQAWLVLTLTSDPLFLGVVAAAQSLPVVTLSVLGGVIADRIDKRRILLATQAAAMILALVLGLLALSGAVTVWHVLLLAAALGCVTAIDLPTRQSFVIELVGPEDVGSAVGLNSSAYNAARFVGPAAAGIVIGLATDLFGDPTMGAGAAFLIDAVSFAAVLVALAMMRAEELNAPLRTTTRSLPSVLTEIRGGFSYVRTTPAALLVLLVPGAIAMLAANFNVLVPALAALEFGTDAEGLGLLMSAVGMGALASSLVLGVGGGAGVRTLILGASGLAAFQIFVALSDDIAFAGIWLFFAAAGGAAMRICANTLLQLSTPPLLRGRVMSLFAIVFEGAGPAGGLLSALVASAFGVRTAFLGIGIGAFLIILAALPAFAGLARAAGATADRVADLPDA